MSKKEAKPMYVPQKEDVVSVDRTAHRSSAWQYFGIHKKALNSSWFVCLKCCKWVSRHDNNTTNMRYYLKSAHGISCLQKAKSKPFKHKIVHSMKII